MPKVIEVDKLTSRDKLDEELTKLHPKKAPINLDKYFGKIKFGTYGLAYQLKARNEGK